ncbi:T9SS type A sorting domain-containing protein [Algibacter sp. R77976]|uniref:T9SS type A sorting domain-containing protein n=1 Tax=Algibacter sp. R77976 TaxID=3093873 RepID=UPI0037CC9C30
MKKITFLFTLLSVFLGYSQNAPIDFESGGNGASWTWTVFENDSNPAVEIIANPVSGGINTSATVMKFTALDAGMNWAGCESMHGSDIGTWTPSTANSYITMKVYQVGFASQVALKFATSTGWAIGETFATVSAADTWVEVSFDMSGWIGGAGGDPDQIIFFPDRSDRTADHIIYIDDVSFGMAPAATCTDGIQNGDETGVDCGGTSCAACVIPEPSDAPTAPTIASAMTISLFSDAYTDLAATWNPNWGQSTVVTDITIASNPLKKYENFNYSGVEPTGGTIDASSMTHINIDYWTSDATELKIKLVDYRGDGAWGGDNIEVEIVSAVSVTEDWVTVSIPLTDFTAANPSMILTDIGQLVLSSTGAINPVYLDNFYFSNGSPLSVNENELGVYKIYPNPSQNSWTVNTQNVNMSSIKVYDVLGKNVLSISPNKAEAIIDGSNLKAGLYFAQIETATGINSIKLIKN